MTEAKTAKRFAIIDGKSVFYRGYYAMPNLATKDGRPTGGVYGFAVMALEVIKRLKPDYVAVAWDKPKTNIRKRLEMYPEYKAGRKPAPPDFYDQVEILHDLLDAFGWPLYQLDDYEADDIMGALAVQAREKGLETMLITSDLDMLQLVNGNVSVYALKTGLSNIELYSPKTFTAKYGIDVHQFLDLKSLKGDSSDNIPGVPGIGEKTAVDLLQQYKTLDGIYENLPLIKDSVRKKLEAGKDLATLSKKLASIWTDAPIKLDLNEVDGSKVQPAKVLHLLQELEFKSLARQLPEVMQVAIENHEIANGKQPIKLGKNVIIDSDEKAKELKLGDSEHFYIHMRSAGKHGRDPQVMIISLNGKDTYTIDLRKVKPQLIVDNFKNVRPLVGYDLKSSLKTLRTLGVKEFPAVGHDVQIGAFLLNPLGREQTFTDLVISNLEYEGTGFEDLSPDELIERAPEVIGAIHALYTKQAKAMEALPKLKKLAHDVEWRVIPVIARMEYAGIKLNVEYLSEFSEKIDDLISDLEQQIYGYAEQEFNISSPGQLAEVLFEQIGLPTEGIKKGKTGFSTAASELDKLRGQHPVIDLITSYREVTKLKSTYVDALPKQVDEHSRVHTTFNMTVAQTGRLSSVDPNLQNIPVRTDLGKQIRTAFEAEPGNLLVSADYSQFELRLAAYLSGDEELIDQFNRDVDVHQATAAEIYDRPPEDITKNMRREAKVVNFGIMYGLGPHGLVQATGMTYGQAQNFIKRYFEVRPQLVKYIDKVKEQARTEGYTETLLGRRRPTPDVHSANFAVREGAMRAAVNMPFQGSAADIMKLAMVKVDKVMSEKFPDARILLQIHDSLILECPAEEAQRVAKLLKETMETAYKLSIKLTVDTSIGPNWGEL